MKKEPERLEMDLQKIFLTPPNTMKEKVTLILMMVVVFVMFFGSVYRNLPGKGSFAVCPSGAVDFLGIYGSAQEPVQEA